MIRIMNNDGAQAIFEDAAIIRVDVKREKQATRFAVETGAVRSDHVIDKLTEISVDLVLATENARAAYDEIAQMFAEHQLVTIQTEMNVWPDMLIEAMPHSESAQIFMGATVQLRFVEWREVEPEYGELKQGKQAKNANQSSEQKRGKQKGSAAATTEPEKQRGSSLLYRWAN